MICIILLFSFSSVSRVLRSNLFVSLMLTLYFVSASLYLGLESVGLSFKTLEVFETILLSMGFRLKLYDCATEVPLKLTTEEAND